MIVKKYKLSKCSMEALWKRFTPYNKRSSTFFRICADDDSKIAQFVTHSTFDQQSTDYISL